MSIWSLTTIDTVLVVEWRELTGVYLKEFDMGMQLGLLP